MEGKLKSINKFSEVRKEESENEDDDNEIFHENASGEVDIVQTRKEEFDRTRRELLQSKRAIKVLTGADAEKVNKRFAMQRNLYSFLCASSLKICLLKTSQRW
jgi:hypothetical protein